ncbi:helix-turn-helix transcriptional regulator [Leeuwenhoekiella marinoflava]|uniref:AlpA family transcriptional regulator n=2 Tax=Leeuwenhoekiella marinoflava TaxID=988 RepID=A0A4Q0P4H3_9FLAO|nr:helix-turn-helix domain-containing protein [Leeuwenhoekiella marinoflava]RXG21245.1 AlpA family transcriptional regulator [Leeuwenhoekiella marinoflava]SHG05049.1 transcriptional regulator, AlpA family [Leeuwenhoekiella marinoflava DSM 3653]
MSSNIEIKRICLYCNNQFTARTTRTKYCSHKCNSRHYKAKQRTTKIDKSNNETERIKVLPIEVVKAKEFLTAKDAATLIGCSLRTVYRLIDNGTLKAVNLSQRMTRVKRSEIDLLMEQPIPQPEVKPTEPAFYDIQDCYSIGEVQNKYNISQSGLRLLLIKNKVPKIKQGKFTYIPKTIINKILT